MAMCLKHDNPQHLPLVHMTRYLVPCEMKYEQEECSPPHLGELLNRAPEMYLHVCISLGNDGL